MDIKKTAWNIFAQTGSIESYLLYNSISGEKGGKEIAANKNPRIGDSHGGLR